GQESPRWLRILELQRQEARLEIGAKFQIARARAPRRVGGPDVRVPRLSSGAARGRGIGPRDEDGDGGLAVGPRGTRGRTAGAPGEIQGDERQRQRETGAEVTHAEASSP